MERVFLVVEQDARVLDGGVPVLHVESHAGTDGLHGGFGHVVVVGRVLRVVEQLVGARQVVEHELVGIVEGGAAYGLLLEILRAEHDALLLFGRGGIVRLAEAFEQLRIAERADGVNLARVLVERFEVGVAGLAGHHRVDPVEVEIAGADHGVELGVNVLNEQVRRTDLPEPEIAVGVRVAFDGIGQVALDVGQQREVAAVESAVHQVSVDADQVLFGVGERLHGIFFGNGAVGVFVQTRGRADERRQGDEAEFYVS